MIRRTLLALVVFAAPVFACRALEPSNKAIDGCIKRCREKASRNCSEGECERGCEMILDRIVERDVEGDTFFPTFDRSVWVETSRRKATEHDDVSFVTLER